MFGLLGSISTRRTPRGEHGVVLLAIARTSVPHATGSVEPLWTSDHVAPPFVER